MTTKKGSEEAFFLVPRFNQMLHAAARSGGGSRQDKKHISENQGDAGKGIPLCKLLAAGSFGSKPRWSNFSRRFRRYAVQGDLELGLTGTLIASILVNDQ